MDQLFQPLKKKCNKNAKIFVPKTKAIEIQIMYFLKIHIIVFLIVTYFFKINTSMKNAHKKFDSKKILQNTMHFLVLCIA
jgi:hypothetical protein